MPTVTTVKAARERRNPDGTVKPPLSCDRCAKPIHVGDPYKHMSIKTGPTSSRRLVRCGPCPLWHVWEYSNSTSARTAQIVHEAHEAIEGVETPDDVRDALASAAEMARELAEEKREGAQNIEDGFGHPTQQSEELTDLADQLDEWATSLEQVDVPELPDASEAECPGCASEGTLPDGSTCEECNGVGHPDEPTEEQMDEWRSEMEDAISPLDDSPV